MVPTASSPPKRTRKFKPTKVSTEVKPFGLTRRSRKTEMKIAILERIIMLIL
jgi:hypothetical protein